MLQKPIVKVWIGVCARPGIVPHTWINRKLHVASKFFQRLDHALRFAQRHGGIFVAVEYPKGERFQRSLLRSVISIGVEWIAPAANCSHRRESLRIFQSEAPGSKTAHAET